MSDLLLVNEVAKLIGRSSSTVVFYENTGKLPATRTQTGVRIFHRADVERFITERLEKEASVSK